MSETRTLRATTLKLVAIRNSRRCNECRSLYGWGTKAWRPTHGNGGYTRDAALCVGCRDELTRELKP